MVFFFSFYVVPQSFCPLTTWLASFTRRHGQTSPAGRDHGQSAIVGRGPAVTGQQGQGIYIYYIIIITNYDNIIMINYGLTFKYD